MKSNPFKYWIYLLILIFVISIFLLLKIVKVDNSSLIPEERSCPQKARFDLYKHISKLNKSNIKEGFPYGFYIDSADYCDIGSIHNDLKIMNAINPDTKENQKILVKALSNKLEEKIGLKFDQYKPDSLIILLQWVNKFNHYKDIDTNNAKFYRMVHRHWYNFVSNKLGQYHDIDPDLKYDYKFKYLVSTCQSQNYPPDIRNSNSTKIIDNIVNNKWAYLFQRFWNGTGFVFKLIISIIILFTFYSYYCVYKLRFKRDNR